MSKKLFKTSIKLAITLIALLLIQLVISINITFKPVAGSSKIYYITVNVGETYESVGINYHCDEDGSYVIYGTDSTLNSYTKVESTSTLWGIEQDPDDAETGFTNRYVCKANLTGLNEETTYYYQIVVGNEASDIKSFKTAPASGSSSFLFLTDTQSSNTSGFKKVNDLVNAIEKIDKNLSMVLMTGDIVDRGGYSAQWNSLFEGLPALERYLQATIPGNHEYYHDNDPAYIDASIYNQFYNNPQNGPSDRINSSYYFKYAEALIIMLDIMPNTKDPYDLEANKAWFKEVVANNPSRWIIVGSHAGAITAGVYAHDAKQIWNNWAETFEECQVDLALSGHEHIYIRKDLWYQGEVNEELGVTYLVGPAAGQKDYAIQNSDGLVALRGNYRGQIVKMQGSKMTVTLYDTTGASYATFTLNAKRNGAPTELTDQDLLDSITCSYDETTKKGAISWTPDAWGNVSKVTCSGDYEWEQVIPSCAEAFATHTLNGLDTAKNYKFTVSMHKKDGTIISKDLTLLLNPDLLPNAVTISGTKKIGVGETSQLTATLTPEGCDQSVIWESEDEAIATVDKNGLVKGISSGRVRIRATSAVNPKVTRTYLMEILATSDPETFEFSAPTNIVVGDEVKLTVTVKPSDASKQATWTTSDASVAQVTSDGTLHALKAGTVTITGTSKVITTLKHSVTITIYSPVTSINITNKVSELSIKKSITLIPSFNEGAPTNPNIIWASSNEEVVKIDKNGKLTPVSLGQSTISATVGDVVESFNITIVEGKQDIAYNLDGGQLPSNAPKSYIEGEGISVLPTPTKDGYTFSGWYNGDTQVQSIDENQTGVVILTAKWDKIAKKGCGCSKSSVMFEVMASITLLAFILRKKNR